ncbi:MAG: glycosyltransferase [Culicoidibacterales bacterium]
MRILHISHYDRYPHESTTFFDKPLNGIEKWLSDMIINTDIEHYVLFFNHYENSIFIEKVLPDGRATVYASYNDINFGKEDLYTTFKDILLWLPLDLIHIHYLQDYIKDLPEILSNLQFYNVVATIHDESYLGSDYGVNQEYSYDDRVANFFSFLSKIVFIHTLTKDRFEKYYSEIIAKKSLIISNGVDLEGVEVVLKRGEEFKVLFLGTMHEVKGGKIVTEISEQKLEGIGFYLLGSIENKPRKLIDYGRYNKFNLAEKVAKIAPDIIVIPSIAEETFSYTAAESTKLGYPVICFNSGVLKNIEKEKRGFVILEKSAEALKQKIISLKDLRNTDAVQWSHILDNVRQAKITSVNQMVLEYVALYETLVGEAKKDKEINWEHVMELNLKDKKRKELLFLYKTHDYEQERAWKKEVPKGLIFFYHIYLKIKKRKINYD